MRRPAQAVLTFLVRGCRTRGGPWGEALLAEYDEVGDAWTAVRWACGGVPVILRERLGVARTPYRIAVIAAVTLAAVLATGLFVLTPRYMPSGGMAPTVGIGGHFLVDRVGFQLTGLHRGDVVELPVPGLGVRTLKRIVGLPGDRIECRDGRLVRNGAVVDEPYLPVGSRTECDPVTVPDRTLYVLGDNRAVSADSRDWGPVGRSTVDGRLLFTLG